MRKCLSSLLLILIFSTLFPSYVAASECPVTNNWQHIAIDEEHLLIAVLRVNNRPVVDSIDLYEHQNRYYIAISQLGFLLNLPWTFDSETHQFASDFNSPKYAKYQPTLCSFDIDLSSSAKGEPNLWYADDFDTYIDVQTIAKLLVGEVEFNTQLQQLNFTSNETSLGLKTSQSHLVSTYYNEIELQSYPVIKDKYRMFTSPIVNYRININSNNTNTSSRTLYQGNVNANFDLLGLASEYRFINNAQGTSQFLKVSKNMVNTADDHLGNIHNIDDRAIKYEAGDITLLGDELVFSTRQVLGGQIYSLSQNQRRNFSNIQIEETVLPGWRGILFRNGQFISEQNADDSNRLVFEDVATFIGINRFSIQLFGPQGQEEHREQVVHVGQNQRQHKQLDFSLSASDAGKTLFYNQSATHNQFNKHVSGTLSYGVTPKLTAQVQWDELVVDEQLSDSEESIDDIEILPKRFVSGSLDYANWSSLFRARYAQNSANGQALYVGVNSNLSSSFSGNLSLKYLDDFESQRHSKNQGLQQEIRGRINGILNVPFRMGVGFNFTEQHFRDQAVRRLLSANTSQNLLGGTFSNSIQYRTQGGENSASHRVFLSKDIGRWQLSQSVTWAPFDKFQILEYSANIRWPQQPTTFNETRLKYNKTSSSKFSVSHQFSWRTKVFNLQVGGSINDKGKWTGRLGISGSFYKNRQSNEYHFTKIKGNNARRIEAVAFIDTDRDGILSEFDEPLPDVEFAGVASWRNAKTNNDGAVQLFTSANYQAVSIEETSLNDPFLSASKPQQIVSTHAGGINKVYFALLPVNDIEGTVVAIKNGKEKGLLGLTVRLYDMDSDKSWETHTESDGYYFFTLIPPGKYSIEVDAEHLSRLNLTQPTKTILEASQFGDIATIDTITLTPITELVSTTNSEKGF